MRTEFLGAALVTGLLLLPPNAEVAIAQCSTGCDSSASCSGSGASWCKAHCTSTALGIQCDCSYTPCDQRARNGEGGYELPDHPLLTSLETTYDGPGFVVAVSVGSFLVADCQGNMHGVAYSIDRALEVERQLRAIRLEGRLASGRPPLAMQMR